MRIKPKLANTKFEPTYDHLNALLSNEKSHYYKDRVWKNGLSLEFKVSVGYLKIDKIRILGNDRIYSLDVFLPSWRAMSFLGFLAPGTLPQQLRDVV